MTRFERAIATGNPGIVVPAALELPRLILLRDGLRVLLVLRDHDLAKYESSAPRWGASLITRRRLALADAQLALAALHGLSADHPVAAGQPLEGLLEHYGESQAAAYLGEWLRSHES